MRAVAADYDSYRQALEDAGVTRRTKNELMVAGIHAALLDLPPRLAAVQEFHSPAPELSTDRLDASAAIWAREVVLGEPRFAPLLEAEPKFSKDTQRPEARRRLAARGITAPEAPEVVQRANGDIDLPALVDAERRQLRRQSSFWTRTLKFASLRREAQARGWRRCEEQTALLAQHRRDCDEFEALIEGQFDLIRSEIAEAQVTRRELKAIAEPIIDGKAAERRAEQAEVVSMFEHVMRRFVDLDPVVNIVVLQAAFADNDGTAAPVGLDDGDLLVLMTMPEPEDVIWPEGPSFGSSMTVKKRTKAQIKEAFETYVLCHSLATAREAFTVQPELERVRVLVLANGDDAIAKRRVLADLLLDADSLSDAGDYVEGQEHAILLQFIEHWTQAQQNEDENRLLSLLHLWDDGVDEVLVDVLAELDDAIAPARAQFQSWINDAVKSRPRLSDLLGDGGPKWTDDNDQFDPGATELETLAVEADELDSVDFWILTALVAERWDDESIDLDALRDEAARLRSLLD